MGSHSMPMRAPQTNTAPRIEIGGVMRRFILVGGAAAAVIAVVAMSVALTTARWLANPKNDPRIDTGGEASYWV